MKAITQDRYGEADVLRLREIDRPTIGDDDVLVRVRAAGVDQGVWHLMTGLPYVGRLALGLRAPRAPVRGMDVAGVVEAVGGNVTRFQPGDEVYGACDGSYAEYARASQDKIARKPKNLSFDQAAAVPVSACTALHGLRDAGQVKPGQHVLVTGAGGGVGTYAVQLAKAFGATVTGVCSTGKVDLVRSLGADHVIDYTQADFTDGARRYDLILDIAGNRPLSQLRRALAPEGTLVIAGGETDGRWFGGFDRGLRAMMLSPFVRQRLRMPLSIGSAADLEYLTSLIEAGTVTPTVDRAYRLNEAAEAIRDLRAGRARGKLVITVAA